MDASNQSNQRTELIQKYWDQTISPQQLSEFQALLASDAAFRDQFFRFVQVDVAVEDMILFHNYMDQPNNPVEDGIPFSEGLLPEPPTRLPSRFHLFLRRILNLLGRPASSSAR